MELAGPEEVLIMWISLVSRPRLTFVGTTHSWTAVAKVRARAAVELVGCGFSIEAIITGFAVAAVLTGAHFADVVPGASPAAIAAVAVFAEVVAVAADAVAVEIAGDAGVIAAEAITAVSFGSFRVAGVGLIVSQQLVGAGTRVGYQGDRQAVEDLDLVVRGSHLTSITPAPATGQVR